MPTFLLKKYNSVKESNTEDVSSDTKNTQTEENDNSDSKELKITVNGSISQIVATALHKVLTNTDVTIQEVSDEEDTAVSVKAISTENINKYPVETLRSVNNNDFVFIQSQGFVTTEEDWFLTNINSKTKNVVYTIESFLAHIKKEFNIL